ncbi:hypothetical protein B0G80_0250 [Paraburkholderia sp. BL6669N2]|uniref:hypothetical protein n=1 Tax=Paraburkholderia sp. BL6669N2 TaxID=1938807 RepID=UPI000E223D08|nr:hypothetical protein [Paraburkholderia sp. BL6669N2]REG57626.1 hypothetical protein B0G80_0250 [Paraburkholderia sp. BL6669N2]
MSKETINGFTWTKEDAIAAYVKIANSPIATLRDRKEACNMILLLNGVTAYVVDQTGEAQWHPEAFEREFPARAEHARWMTGLRRDVARKGGSPF